MAPFRWPTASNDIMLGTEVAARKPKSPADWETIVGILSQAFRVAVISLYVVVYLCDCWYV